MLTRSRRRISLLRMAVAAVAAALLSLTIGSPAAADIGLMPDHVNTTAADFSPQECNEPFADKGPNDDGWHFVLPMSVADDFVSVTLNFDTPNGAVQVGPITSQDQNVPDTGPGWSGYLDNAGASEKHLYLTTEAGWTLTGGTAEVSPDTDTGSFNLSHTCPGTPANGGNGIQGSPTPSPSNGMVPSGAAATGGGGSQARAGVLAGTGALVIATGAAAGFALARRRRDAA